VRIPPICCIFCYFIIVTNEEQMSSEIEMSRILFRNFFMLLVGHIWANPVWLYKNVSARSDNSSLAGAGHFAIGSLQSLLHHVSSSAAGVGRVRATSICDGSDQLLSAQSSLDGSHVQTCGYSAWNDGMHQVTASSPIGVCVCVCVCVCCFFRIWMQTHTI